MQLIIVSISLLLFCIYAALLVYYTIAWNRIPTVTTATESAVKISVIIPARNEAANISTCLDSVCNQQYPAQLFEVIVVDDHSTDETAAIVQQCGHPAVKLVSLSDHLHSGSINSYKKKAIETAVAQCTGTLIVTTDADCIVPAGWLQAIAGLYSRTEASFIAMPVVYNSARNFLEIFQCLDFMTLQGITGASVYKRIHSMCNGANLAYSKKAFEAVDGFKGIDHVASGDDMLLMHKIYSLDPSKVFFLKSKEVIVKTAPMKTVKSFLHQRIRWASKADRYDDKRIFAVLLLVYLFNVALLLLPLISLFTHAKLPLLNLPLFQYWLLLLLVKTTVELLFLYPVAGFFSQRRLLIFFPLAQPFHIFYTVLAGWLGKFGSYQWKDRKVH